MMELLLGMIIIAVLATVTLDWTFNRMESTRDSSKKVTAGNLARVILADGAFEDDQLRYVYQTSTFGAVLERVGFPLSNSLDERVCFYVSMGGGPSNAIASDNRFVIATWGDRSSTDNPESGGIIAIGDQDSQAHFIDSNLVKSDFECDTTSQANLVQVSRDAEVGNGIRSGLLVKSDGTISEIERFGF